MRTASVFVFICTAPLSAMPISAYADDASVILTAEYVTEYVFRGVTLAGEAIQPSLEASYGGLTAGVWSSFAVGEEKDAFADEIDFYISSRWNLADMVSGEIGATLYHFPDSGGVFDIGDGLEDASTVEIYGGIDFDVFLSPNFSAYYDVNLKNVTLETSIAYALSVIDDVTIETAVKAGLVEASEGLNYQYGKLSANLYFDVTDRAAFFAGAHYGLSSRNTFLDTNFDLSDPETLKDPTDNSSWFSIGVTSTF